MTNPTISVAMTTYNGATHLRQQLDSLAMQSRLPSELVVCDDGSTDSTLDILKEFAETARFPVHIHRNSERLGFADNFLGAARRCTGEWISFCDQDDVWYADKLSTVATGIQQNSQISVITHSADLADEDLTLRGRRMPDHKRTEIAAPLTNPLIGCLSGFSLTFSAKLLAQFNWEDRPNNPISSKPLLHDAWITFLGNVCGGILYISRSLAIYRRHASTVMSDYVAVGSLGAQLRNKMCVSESHCLLYAAHFDQCADYLRAQATSDTEWAAAMNSAADHYNLAARAFRARGHLYTSCALDRPSLLFRMVVSQMYGERRYGGLGHRAFIKDLVVSLLGVPPFRGDQDVKSASDTK